MDNRTEDILADLFAHLLATIVDTHSDASTQLALVGKATSLLRLIAAAYQQRQQRELDALVEKWAAQEQTNSSHQELIEAP